MAKGRGGGELLDSGGAAGRGGEEELDHYSLYDPPMYRLQRLSIFLLRSHRWGALLGRSHCDGQRILERQSTGTATARAQAHRTVRAPLMAKPRIVTVTGAAAASAALCSTYFRPAVRRTFRQLSRNRGPQAVQGRRARAGSTTARSRPWPALRSSTTSTVHSGHQRRRYLVGAPRRKGMGGACSGNLPGIFI